MLKNILNSDLNFIPLLNPFIYDEINRMEEYCGLNKETQRETDIIVSLTAQKDRFKYLPAVIYSLLNQSLKPDRIILWADEETEDMTTLPYNITRFVKNGLEIRFVKDLKSYTNTIYAFNEFKDSIIVTADDNIYYRKKWLERLYISYIAHPEDIHVHKALKASVTPDCKNLMPYQYWYKKSNEETASFDNLIITSGGVLYPPNCFNNEIYRKDIFMSTSPDCDNLWYWTIALANGRKIRVVKNHYKFLIVLNYINHLAEQLLNRKCLSSSINLQMQALMKYYGRNVINKLVKSAK